ncbi:hypothetical protein F4780DRAFT_768354 [Xylariomycetidae sp. FL0641]|nr:hypothetical protein F4780DRAFT_768354 [Xylariomycetidae sp. FL0641]
MQANKTLMYNQYTPRWPQPGTHLTVEARPFDAAAPPPPGGVTVKNEYLTFDGYIRGQMRPAAEAAASYSTAWTVGSSGLVAALATVLRSDHPAYAPGDRAFFVTSASAYAAVGAEAAGAAAVFPRLPPSSLPLGPAQIAGVLGVSGLSAYASFFEYVPAPRAGRTLVVNAAAGGVGQVVGQLGKLQGMRVVGSTGSAAKAAWLVDELGFDGAWDCSKEDTAGALERLAPEGVDVLYDNVGGEQLETTITKMKDFGTIVISGQISQYNKTLEETYGVRTLMQAVFKRLTIRGFVCVDPPYAEKYMASFGRDMLRWIAEGKMKFKSEVVVGMDKAPEAIIRMWMGDKFGKMVLKVDED